MHVISELVSEVGYLIGHCKRAAVPVQRQENLAEQPSLQLSIVAKAHLRGGDS